MTEEKELIDRLSRGETSAFRELVEAYKKKVYYLAQDITGNSADAEDISQEVFLKVFRSFKTFKKGSKLGCWLYRITYNTSIDHLRRRSLSPEPVEDEVLDASGQNQILSSTSPSQNPAFAAETRFFQAQIERALEKVSAQERMVFLLRHYNDLMLRDIAETLNVSIGSVKSYLFRCIQKLRKELAPPEAMSRDGGSDESL